MERVRSGSRWIRVSELYKMVRQDFFDFKIRELQGQGACNYIISCSQFVIYTSNLIDSQSWQCYVLIYITFNEEWKLLCYETTRSLGRSNQS